MAAQSVFQVVHLVVLAAALGCNSSTSSSGGKGGGSGADCEVIPGYQYLYSCLGLSSSTMCVDYYSNVPASAVIGLEQACTITNGKILDKPCSTDGAAGTCTGQSSFGTMGVVEVITDYGTPASLESSCSRAGRYAAPGVAPSLPGTAPGNQCGAASETGFAFSLPLRVNGVVLACTNFSGSFSEAEVTALGGEQAPCTTMGANGSCELMSDLIPSATRQQEVSYNVAHGNLITAADCTTAGGSFNPVYLLP